MKQIFVRGMSRSGGTLMATILDAHPEVAMSYEIYEHLLEPDDGVADRLMLLQDHLGAALKGWSRKSSKITSRISDRPLRTFVARAARGGIEPRTLLTLADEHAAQGRTFGTFRDRMQFVESVAAEKMNREGKRHWGVKSTSDYDNLREQYAEAYFLFMKRDGRDIAASRKFVGEFNQPVERIAHGWCRQNRMFKEFASRPGVRGRMVNYERLTAEPEAELREVMEFLELPWDQRLLYFHAQDLSLYRHPMGHLSANQVNKPINTSSVGRWKQQLTPEEVVAFESVAGPALSEFGYELSGMQEGVRPST